MTNTEIILALALFMCGRKLLLMSVMVIGFWAGFAMAIMLLPQIDGWQGVALYILCGILGAFLLRLFQWILVVFTVGFAGGGYVLVKLYPLIAEHVTFTGDYLPTYWIFAIGGMIGALIMAFAFDWILIGISCFLGAALIVQNLDHVELFPVMMVICMALAGVLLQSLSLRPMIFHREEDAEERRPVAMRRNSFREVI